MLSLRFPAGVARASAAHGKNAGADEIKVNESRIMFRFLFALHRDEKPSEFKANGTNYSW